MRGFLSTTSVEQRHAVRLLTRGLPIPLTVFSKLVAQGIDVDEMARTYKQIDPNSSEGN